MLKKILTTLGMAFSTVSLATTGLAPEEGKETRENELNFLVQESCGHLTDTNEFELCVQIVEMDFTVIPQNTGGRPTEPL